MIIVGELINTSRKSVARAVQEQNAAYIRDLAKSQAAAGAHYIDVNAGTFLEKEVMYLSWLVEIVQSAVDLPLCLDSPNPQALENAIKVHHGVPLINSISLETNRFEKMMPIITQSPCRVIGLCMSKTAMPTSSRERSDAAAQMIEKLIGAGVAMGDIFIDPLVQPVSVDTRTGAVVLDAIREINGQHPHVNIICGLSNISFGLPERRLINRQFLCLAIYNGLTSAILDPTDPHAMAVIKTTRMLLGRDAYCADFLDAYEQGILRH